MICKVTPSPDEEETRSLCKRQFWGKMHGPRWPGKVGQRSRKPARRLQVGLRCSLCKILKVAPMSSTCCSGWKQWGRESATAWGRGQGAWGVTLADRANTRHKREKSKEDQTTTRRPLLFSQWPRPWKITSLQTRIYRLISKLLQNPEIVGSKKGFLCLKFARRMFWFSRKEEGSFLELQASGLVIIPSVMLKRVNWKVCQLLKRNSVSQRTGIGSLRRIPARSKIAAFKY